MNMNLNRVIGTAVLVLLLGITIPAFAQQEHEKKGEGGGQAQQAQQQAQPQHAQQAQPQHTQQAQPQHAQQTQPQHAQQAQPQHTPQAQPSVAQNRGNNGNHYGRISDDHYRANFGHSHSFHMIRPQMISGYQRFQYGGYWFGFNGGWPIGWSYDDDVYVEYVGGVYYLYDLRHPGIHITLNMF
jgi:hypothetical protein